MKQQRPSVKDGRCCWCESGVGQEAHTTAGLEAGATLRRRYPRLTLPEAGVLPKAGAIKPLLRSWGAGLIYGFGLVHGLGLAGRGGSAGLGCGPGGCALLTGSAGLDPDGRA